MYYRDENWGMGKKRSYNSYLKMVGIDMEAKKITRNEWCHQGQWPEIAKPFYWEKPKLSQ